MKGLLGIAAVRRAPRIVRVAAVALAVAAVTGGSVRAEDLPSCPSDTKAAYAIALTALTGPQGADAFIEVAAAPGCAAVQTLKKVQLKTFAPDGSLAAVRNLTDVAAPEGAAVIPLGEIERGRAVEADVLVQTGTPPRTYPLRGEATTRLRPDLTVVGVNPPEQTTTSRPIDVVVDLEELNGDTGATANVRLTLGDVPLAAPAPVTVAAGGEASITFPGVTLPDPVESELLARVTDAEPAETDTSNNAGTTSVDVTEHELERSLVFLSSLGGFGVQMNGHVYAGVLPAPPASTPGLEAKVKDLEPQLVRIFFNEVQEAI